MLTRLFRSAPPEPPAHIDLIHAGKTFRIRLKRDAAARRFTLRVRTATRDIVLTMPARGALKTAQDFAKRHGAWIEARLERLPDPVRFADGQVIPLRGVDHCITHRPGLRKTVWIEPNNNRTSAAPMLLCVSGEVAHVGRRIGDYLKRAARQDLEAAVAHHTRAIGRSATRLTLRDQASRWGSCSSKGSLNFSWRLIFAPAFVLDYLAAHEVAHLVHMNHSPQFWALTRSLMPDLDRAEAWLKLHGSGLHRYGGAHG